MTDPAEAAKRILGGEWHTVKLDDGQVLARAYLDDEALMHQMNDELDMAVARAEKAEALCKQYEREMILIGEVGLEAKRRMEQAEADVDELVAALKAAQEHLDYTGYGDSWERSCAKESKLEERINAVLAKHKKVT